MDGRTLGTSSSAGKPDHDKPSTKRESRNTRKWGLMPGTRTVILIGLAVVVGWELIWRDKPWTIGRVGLMLFYILILVFFFYSRMTGLTIPWDPFDPG